MKIIKIIIILMTLMFFAFAQDELVDIKATSICTDDANTYQIDILIKANNANSIINVAEQNYRFSYDSLVLENPRILDSGIDFTGFVLAANGDFSLYTPHTLKGSLKSIVSYNIELAGGIGTLLQEDEWSKVGTLEFDVIDQSAVKEITWLGSDDFPPTVIVKISDNERKLVKPNFYPTETAGNNTALISAFRRTWQHPCLNNEGWLKLDWNDIDDEDELFISIDGGLNFNSVSNNSGQFLVNNLSAGDYDIQIKLAEEDCPITLDDVNLVNLGFEATMEYDFSCAENSGFITLNWPPSPYTNALKVSINGGKLMTINDELGTYTFNGLKAGNYSVKVYNKSGACSTDLGAVTLTGNNDAPEITRSWKHSNCGQNDGSITLSWVDNPNVEQVQISTDGGNTFASMPTSQQVFKVENLTVGDYDVWVKWGTAADACAIQLDDVNLINNAPANTGLTMQYSCENKKMSLIDSGYAAQSLRQFRYRTLTGADWSNWVITDFVQEDYFDVAENIEDVAEIQYQFKIQCDDTWSMWSAPKTSAMPQCKLGSASNFLPVAVVPNPFNKRFNINITNNLFKTQKAKIEVTNLIGKIIYTKMVELADGENSFVIEPNAAMSAGIYLANIILDDGTRQTTKLLKE